MTTQDLQAPFDVTAYAGLNGAQILQLINGASPATNVGMFILSTDIATVPQVPNANVTTKWQNYGWIRKSAVGVTLYIWNPFAPNDPTLLYWQSVSITNLGVGTVTTVNIADNAVTDAKIASISYSKIINPPAGLPPSGVAGGDLTGTYPNPSVAAAAITSAKIAAATILGSNIAANTVGLTNLVTNAANRSIIQALAGVNTWVVASPIATSAGVTLAANQLPVVNPGATDFQMQTVAQVLNSARKTSTARILAAGSKLIDGENHNLGAIPLCMEAYMIAQGAANGYALSEIVSADRFFCRIASGFSEPLFSLSASATTYTLTQSAHGTDGSLTSINTIGAFVLNKATGVVEATTIANWHVYMVVSL